MPSYTKKSKSKPVCKRCLMARWVMVIGMLAIMASVLLLNQQPI